MLVELWSTILADLTALYVAHQSAHWRASGESFYGDHQLFQRMYEETADEVDQVAERLLGITGDDSLVDPSRRLAMASAAIKNILSNGDLASSLLIAEKAFVKQIAGILDALEAMGQLSDGTENLLQGIADKHEEHVYLLSRRVGIEVLKVCVKEALGQQKIDEGVRKDAVILKRKLAEARRKRKKKDKTVGIGGPISTGPGNPGFNSSAGPGAC